MLCTPDVLDAAIIVSVVAFVPVRRLSIVTRYLLSERISKSVFVSLVPLAVNSVVTLIFERSLIWKSPSPYSPTPFSDIALASTLTFATSAAML